MLSSTKGPFDPRYNKSFDNTGRHHTTGKGRNKQWQEQIMTINAKRMKRNRKGLTTISRMAELGEAIVGNLNTKFKFCLNAVIIVVQYALEEMSRPMVVVPIGGFCIGVAVHASNKRLDYLVFTHKGGKDR